MRKEFTTISADDVAYLKIGEIACYRIVCDCGEQSKSFIVLGEKTSRPDSLIELKTRCKNCKSRLLSRVFVYEPMRLVHDTTTTLEARDWSGLNVPASIECGKENCKGESEIVFVLCSGKGLVKAISQCKMCRSIVTAHIDFV